MGGKARVNKDLDRRWEEMYRELKKYQKEHGDCQVPQGFKDSPHLARWVNSQRERQRQGTMPEDRKERLDGLGFWWGTSNEDRWNAMFEKLKDFKEVNGHFHVPCSYKTDPPFSKWVTKQKANLRSDDLTLERKEKLMSIGFPGPKPRKNAKRKNDDVDESPSAKRPAIAEQDTLTTASL